MQRRHRAAHRKIWAVLAFVIPAIFVGAMIARQAEPDPETSAVRLSAPPGAKAQ